SLLGGEEGGDFFLEGFLEGLAEDDLARGVLGEGGVACVEPGGQLRQVRVGSDPVPGRWMPCISSMNSTTQSRKTGCRRTGRNVAICQCMIICRSCSSRSTT